MSDPDTLAADNLPVRQRTGRRGRARSEGDKSSQAKPPVWPGVVGGLYKPLSEADLPRIHGAALDVLESVGLSQAPDFVVRRVTDKGGRLSDDGRLTFPRALVEDALAGFRRDIVLHGQTAGHEMELSGGRVYMGSGGAAPSMIDLETGLYRDSTLRDLYDAARMVDALDNIHFFSRSVVARDMPTNLALDVNTAYACLKGTAKHVSTSAVHGAHVPLIARMVETIAGSQAAFADKPFLSVNINHVIPPMRFYDEACGVMEQCALHGLPFHVNSTGQAGASSPATLAGSVVQAVVETLAGMVFTWLVNPKAQAVFGPRPLVTDLRTGAMTGGCGEQAVAMAAGAQMGRFYDLPSSCIAGATDSKIPDAQSGYEKSLTVSLAAHAGCNMVTQACGMQASLMGCSHESYVIDNDMLGGILRSVRGIEVDETTLARELIAEVVRGDGHYLGAADTFQRMQSDFLYPQLADRQSADDWQKAGGHDIRTLAKQRAREILEQHHPGHIDSAVDAQLRDLFDIRLDLEP